MDTREGAQVWTRFVTRIHRLVRVRAPVQRDQLLGVSTARRFRLDVRLLSLFQTYVRRHTRGRTSLDAVCYTYTQACASSCTGSTRPVVRSEYSKRFCLDVRLLSLFQTYVRRYARGRTSLDAVVTRIHRIVRVRAQGLPAVSILRFSVRNKVQLD